MWIVWHRRPFRFLFWLVPNFVWMARFTDCCGSEEKRVLDRRLHLPTIYGKHAAFVVTTIF